MVTVCVAHAIAILDGVVRAVIAMITLLVFRLEKIQKFATVMVIAFVEDVIANLKMMYFILVLTVKIVQYIYIYK